MEFGSAILGDLWGRRPQPMPSPSRASGSGPARRNSARRRTLGAHPRQNFGLPNAAPRRCSRYTTLSIAVTPARLLSKATASVAVSSPRDRPGSPTQTPSSRDARHEQAHPADAAWSLLRLLDVFADHVALEQRDLLPSSPITTSTGTLRAREFQEPSGLWEIDVDPLERHTLLDDAIRARCTKGRACG